MAQDGIREMSKAQVFENLMGQAKELPYSVLNHKER